ncbi:hypothetical protein CSB20_04800 [bacterium DOLZORAL124_64_63]|nr:MAG: hypothetical protein CSB20_04800 [bacterium DOLZORAL124_64_63]
MRVRTGLDRLAAAGCAALRGRRVGLLVHPASVDGGLRHAVDLCAGAGVDLRALFGPQHGILGQTQDNMIEWEGFIHPRLGCPVHSLYGQHRKPTPEMLAGLDVLVVDLQDVGARYYTFIWTLLLCLEACAEAGVAVMVLDRPNPLGGDVLEGPVLDMAYRSFVGLAPIPMRHGLTIGELAGWFVRQRDLDVELDVVWCEGWRRADYFDATGLPWVLPSPNMPTLQTAVVYPGGCLLEGTLLSEGRGTTRPFEIFGAPYVDGRLLAEKLAVPGCVLRPLSFEPTFHKFAGQLCGGVQVHVTDRAVFRSVALYTAAIALIHAHWGAEFGWKPPPYEYETDKRPIDILAGGPDWRRDVAAGCDARAMVADWQAGLERFRAETEDCRHHA